MAKPATDRLKFNPPLGVLPALQYLLPQQLEIDAQYQRSLCTEQSQVLVRAIAQHWNWDLCQPLVVARRPDGRLYVIDGQHRLEAARLRGDIAQLPAVVVQYSTVEDEAASFVLLNQQRKPLTKIDLFKAAVASGDTTASAIVAAIDAAGLTIAPHTNHTTWKPGMVSNIGGIEQCWRGRGAVVTGLALKALAHGFAGQVLRYAGTIFPGIAALIDVEVREAGGPGIDPEIWSMIVEMLGATSQEDWRTAIMQVRVDEPNLKFARASEKALLEAWREVLDEAFGEEPEGRESEDGETDDGAAGGDEDGFDTDDGAEDDALDDELAQPWEDGSEAEPVLAPASVPAPAVKARPAPKPAPPSPGPKTAPKIDWGKLSAAASRQAPAAGKGPRPFKPDSEGKAWCQQCDARVTGTKAANCKDWFCDFRSASGATRA